MDKQEAEFYEEDDRTWNHIIIAIVLPVVIGFAFGLAALSIF
jgi:hypothetical protein